MRSAPAAADIIKFQTIDEGQGRLAGKQIGF